MNECTQKKPNLTSKYRRATTNATYTRHVRPAKPTKRSARSSWIDSAQVMLENIIFCVCGCASFLPVIFSFSHLFRQLSKNTRLTLASVSGKMIRTEKIMVAARPTYHGGVAVKKLVISAKLLAVRMM
jgi:hypothetical protein